MKYRKVPKTGDKLSVLGYGCMRFPTKGLKIDEEKAERQMLYAIEKGVNYFDTGIFYHAGASEPFLGKVLKRNNLREKVKIATKLPPMMVHRREDMERILDGQLKKFQTNYIDYYLIHGISRQKDWDKLKEIGIFEFFENAKKQGKILNIGFSNHAELHTFKGIIDDYDGWDFCQIQYNYLDENNQAGKEGLEYAYSKNLAVIVMEPLRGGNLANKIPKEVNNILNQAAVRRTPAQWAFEWLYDHKEVTVVLSGMNDDKHIEENIKTANKSMANSFTQEDKSIINQVKNEFGKLLKINCTGCRYCMPCPAGVNIPVCFEQYNSRYLFNGKLMAQAFYMMRLGSIFEGGKETEYASKCIQCGKCEVKCPQHLKIIQELKQVKKELEKPWMKVVSIIAKRAVGFFDKK